jgi:hypothetical protein
MANQQVRNSISNIRLMLIAAYIGIMIDNAMDLVPRPPWSERQAEEYFAMTMKDALAHGLTSIHDAESQPEAISLFKK